MTVNRYRTGSQHVATSTVALILLLPSIGNSTDISINTDIKTEYQELGEVGALVADAVSPRIYTTASSESLSNLLLNVASKLVTQSKSLDPDFSAVVDREFWNLLA